MSRLPFARNRFTFSDGRRIAELSRTSKSRYLLVGRQQIVLADSRSVPTLTIGGSWNEPHFARPFCGLGVAHPVKTMRFRSTCMLIFPLFIFQRFVMTRVPSRTSETLPAASGVTKVSFPDGVGCDSLRFRAVTVSEIPLPRAGTAAPIDADLAPNGSVLVLDRLAQAVEVYSTTGKRLGQIAPPPGRFSLSLAAGAIVVSEHGALFIWDPIKQQIVKTPLDSLAFSGFTVVGVASAGMPAPLWVTTAGDFYLGLRAPTVSGTSMEDAIVVLDSNGRFRSTIGPFPNHSTLRLAKNGTTSVVSLPFDLADRVVWAVGPSGQYATASSRSYNITLTGPTGTTHVVRSVPPVPLNSEDYQTALSSAGTTGFNVPMIRRLLPTHKSPVTELLLGERWLLVRRPTVGSHIYNLVYDLYSLPQRSFCSTLHLHSRITAVRGDTLVGIKYTPAGSMFAVVTRLDGGLP